MNQIKQENLDYKLKLMFLGESGTGKTTLIQRMIESIQFDMSNTPTFGYDQQNKMICLNEKNILLELYDTAGQEKLRCLITKQFYQQSDGIFFLFDDEDSLDGIENYWIVQAKDICTQNTVFCILANKSDEKSLTEKIIEKGRNLAEKQECHFFITSSKTNEGVLEARNKMVEKIIENYEPKSKSQILLAKNLQAKQNHQGCC